MNDNFPKKNVIIQVNAHIQEDYVFKGSANLDITVPYEVSISSIDYNDLVKMCLFRANVDYQNICKNEILSALKDEETK